MILRLFLGLYSAYNISIGRSLVYFFEHLTINRITDNNYYLYFASLSIISFYRTGIRLYRNISYVDDRKICIQQIYAFIRLTISCIIYNNIYILPLKVFYCKFL